MEKRDRLIDVLGMIFVLLGISAIINTVVRDSPEGILWFCYIGIILIGIGMLMNSSVIISSQLNILFIPLIVWTIDFIGFLITGSTPFGIVDYFFNSEFHWISRLISSQHVFTVPVSMFVLYRMNSKNISSWRVSFIQVIVVFAITRILTPQENNINCVFESCIGILQNIIPSMYYPFAWIAAFFLLVFSTNFLINKLLSIKK